MMDKVTSWFMALPEPIQVVVTFFGGLHILFFGIMLLVSALWLGMFALPIVGALAACWYGCTKFVRFYKGKTTSEEEKIAEAIAKKRSRQVSEHGTDTVETITTFSEGGFERKRYYRTDEEGKFLEVNEEGLDK